eukprot:13531052-Alexandrium_andersonii.AAC.1
MKDGGCRARMTIQDLKKSGASGDWTHCPTSPAVSNHIGKYKACANGDAIIRADVISDSPHAKLQADPVYMKCPEEVYNHPEIRKKLKEKGIEPFWSDDDEL